MGRPFYRVGFRGLLSERRRNVKFTLFVTDSRTFEVLGLLCTTAHRAWMLARDCAEMKITKRPLLNREALLSLASLISLPPASEDHAHDNLLQTAVEGCKGGRRGATTTSGPDDPKRKRDRAAGRSDTHRSDRSHGPRFWWRSFTRREEELMS
jgi:hypothetical protein